MCRAESYQLEVPDYHNDCLPFINHVVASYEKDQNRRSNAPKPTPKASRPLPTTRRSFGSIPTTRRPFRPIPTTRRPPVAARKCSFFGV
uniref:Uncharacterized protein n=1 Tax=Romanomermis culicivorax TaxID=13658 RepID=A0A915K2S8_ROMCU